MNCPYLRVRALTIVCVSPNLINHEKRDPQQLLRSWGSES
jgi:hypothetical protein